MSLRPTGALYARTTGAICDYRALAEHIHRIIDYPYDYIIDAPCGTMDLLHHLRSLFPVTALIGIDNSIAQLAYGMRRFRSDGCRCICADIVKGFPVFGTGCAILHMGYCFFNVLPPEARRTVLRELMRNRAVTRCLIEFQNEDHQSQFVAGRWYSWKGRSGLEYRTRSSTPIDGVRQIEMEYRIDGRLIRTVDQLYPLSITECDAICFDAGWSVNYLEAEYREQILSGHSHWLACLCKG